MAKSCAQCQTTLTCEASTGLNCWCQEYPSLLSPASESDCLCPDCLTRALQEPIQQITQAILEQGSTNDVANRYTLPSKKLLEGIDFYREGGRYVMTTWYLLKRGYCCGNRCRHCPYRHQNVPA
jgi:hypothetical protein